MSESDEDEFEDEETEEFSLKDITDLIQRNFAILLMKNPEGFDPDQIVTHAAVLANQMIEAATEIQYDQGLTESVQFQPED